MRSSSLLTQDSSKFLHDKLTAMSGDVRYTRREDGWVARHIAGAPFEEFIAAFENDLERLQDDLAFIGTGKDGTADTMKLVELWQEEQEITPSLMALVVYAFDRLDISLHSKYLDMALTAAFLGEIPNDKAYHGNIHYRKIMVQTIRMIDAHNRIHQDDDVALGSRDIALLLTAVAVHDLAHDGRGNLVESEHYPGRLEIRAFDEARPWLEAAGCTGRDLSDLKIMIRCTDISPPGSSEAPSNLLKASYQHHFSNEDMPASLPEELGALAHDPKLALLALMLHEADISVSAGLGYEITEHEALLLEAEKGTGHAVRPSDIAGFLERICNNEFLTPAGEMLFQTNLEKIYAQAKKRISEGDEPVSSQDAL